MNYLKAYDGKPLLKDTPQPLVVAGELRNPYTGRDFCQAWVNTYNRYTQQYNKATDRATQEFYLDQRHKFFCQCVDIQMKNRGTDTRPKLGFAHIRTENPRIKCVWDGKPKKVPKRGEYYISGCPGFEYAYRANNDLTIEYFIAVPINRGGRL